MLTATLRKWGGSVALPIPPAILSSLGLHSGAEVSLSISDGRLVMKPARKYSFKKLVAEHKALGIEPDREWLEFPALPSEQAKA
jgi:antitoxin component of MazEF toxin-antitoxin module